MSIIEHTLNIGLTQYTGSSVKAQFYTNYNADMVKIDEAISNVNDDLTGLGDRVSALETEMQVVSNKVDEAVTTANEAKTIADAMDARVTSLEERCDDLESWKNNIIDPTLNSYNDRLESIEAVIETVSTANIKDLIERIDALEQKVDTNAQNIDILNTNLIAAVNDIRQLEVELGNTNSALTAVGNRVIVLENCCEEVRTTLTEYNTRIVQNASDIDALEARLTRDETNIAGNASDITILATQNNTQAGQIQDLYEKIENVDTTKISESVTENGLTFAFSKVSGWIKIVINGTTSEAIADGTTFINIIPENFSSSEIAYTRAIQPISINDMLINVEIDGRNITFNSVNGNIASGTVLHQEAVYC